MNNRSRSTLVIRVLLTPIRYSNTSLDLPARFVQISAYVPFSWAMSEQSLDSGHESRGCRIAMLSEEIGRANRSKRTSATQI